MRPLSIFFIFALFFLAPSYALANEGSFTFSAYGETGEFKPDDSSFLGRRVTLTPGTEQYDFAPINDSAEYHGYGVGFSYNLGDIKYFDRQTTIFGAAHIGNIIDKQEFGALDPDGLALLIPGVGVGPDGEGFELPPPLNQTADTQYRSESDEIKISLGLQRQMLLENCHLSLSPFAGLQYKHFRTDKEFTGDIPLFISSFAYNTDIEIHSISPFIGTDVSYPISEAISFIGSFKYMYDINFGDGDDNLDFTGFNRQTASLNNDENSHSAELEAGLNFQISSNINFAVTAKYGRYGNIPVMETRTGSRPSDFNYKTGEIITGGARLTVRF